MEFPSATLSHKPTAIDLFAGAGGLSLGLMQAGFDVRFALDNDEDAVRTYRYNLGPHIALVSAHETKIDDILIQSRLERGECDLLVGGPPCQGFSQHRLGQDFDERNDLVNWFAHAVVSSDLKRLSWRMYRILPQSEDSRP